MNKEVTPQELELLINQTYKVENDFKELRDSYASLQRTIEEVVEFLPNAIWILEDDKTIFLQNSQAKELEKLLPILKLDQNDYELMFGEYAYLVKTTHHQNRYLVSVTDITEQKRKENLATMGQMAAHLSHEIRNPIGSISLLTSILKKRVVKENEQIVQEIEKSIYRIEGIIKSTLMFSKGIQADFKILHWRDIRQEIETTIEYYSFDKDIDFYIAEDDFELYGDMELLIMMFSNFIVNAIDAIELGDDEVGVVEIEYKNNDKFHYFYIYDSGVEIEDDNKLFEAFSSTKVKGNGLGLVLSKQIANAHQGDARLLKTDKKIFEVTLAKRPF